MTDKLISLINNPDVPNATFICISSGLKLKKHSSIFLIQKLYVFLDFKKLLMSNDLQNRLISGNFSPFCWLKIAFLLKLYPPELN